MGRRKAADCGLDVRACERCAGPLPAERLRYQNTRFCSEGCRWRAYHVKHSTALREYNRKWKDGNPDKCAGHRLKSRDKRLVSLKAWKARNPERTKELKRLSDKRCREQIYARQARWNKENADRNRQHKRKWKQLNPAMVLANTRDRLIAQRKARPAWLTKEQDLAILFLYKKAAELTKTTGVPHEVDHIVPIRSQIVCGLHVPWNLQVITQEENRHKKNKLLCENF